MNRFAGILFCLITLTSFGQSSREWGFEARCKLGFLAAHRGVMGHLATEHAMAGELTWFNQSKGEKELDK